MTKTKQSQPRGRTHGLRAKLRWIGAAKKLQALQLLSPQLAARSARRLFMTPERYAAPKHELDLLASATRFSIPFNGGKLAAWKWTPAGRADAPIVYLLHGWAGRGGQMANFAPPLAALGYAVVAIDGPAHGKSDGELASALLFRNALRATVDHHGAAHAIIAHSMGCASTTLALDQGMRASRLVYIGAARTPTFWVVKFAGHLGLNERTIAAMKKGFEEEFHVPWEDIDIVKSAPRRDEPLLLVHDEDDRDTNWEDSALIAKHWKGANLHLTQGLGHRRILKSPEVIAAVTDFIADSVAPPRA